MKIVRIDRGVPQYVRCPVCDSNFINFHLTREINLNDDWELTTTCLDCGEIFLVTNIPTQADNEVKDACQGS